MTRRDVVRLEVDGLKPLVRDLRQLGPELVNELKDTSRQAGQIIVHAARPPRRTGKLAASGRAARLAAGVRVMWGRASVPYAGAIHYGWPAHNIAAQPFATEAAHDTEPEWLELYQRGIDRAVAHRMESLY